jgi:hypothetical protein
LRETGSGVLAVDIRSSSVMGGQSATPSGQV